MSFYLGTAVENGSLDAAFVTDAQFSPQPVRESLTIIRTVLESPAGMSLELLMLASNSFIIVCFLFCCLVPSSFALLIVLQRVYFAYLKFEAIRVPVMSLCV